MTQSTLSLSDLQGAWLTLKKGTLWKAYAKANPNESASVDNYVTSIIVGSPSPAPSPKTYTGQALVDVVAAWILLPAPIPPSPPVSSRGPSSDAAHLSGPIGLTSQFEKLTNSFVTCPESEGVQVYKDGTGCVLDTLDVGQCKDSCVIFEDSVVGGNSLTNSLLHDSSVNGGESFGVHGLYDSAADSYVKNCEAWNHPGGECFSHRWPNTNFKCISRDSPHAVGVYDYSDGRGGLLLIREMLAYNISEWFLYMDSGRWSHTQTPGEPIGPATFGLCLDHCTLDLRACKTAYPINFQHVIVESYLTNCLIIWDGGDNYYFGPSDGTKVTLSGNVVINSSQFSQFLNSDYTPKQVSNSPILGKAVSSPAVSSKFGDLPNVGAF